MSEEINFCKVGEYGRRRIEEELLSKGVEYTISFDDVQHCGVLVVSEGDFETAANIVLHWSELKGDGR